MSLGRLVNSSSTGTQNVRCIELITTRTLPPHVQYVIQREGHVSHTSSHFITTTSISLLTSAAVRLWGEQRKSCVCVCLDECVYICTFFSSPSSLLVLLVAQQKGPTRWFLSSRRALLTEYSPLPPPAWSPSTPSYFRSFPCGVEELNRGSAVLCAESQTTFPDGELIYLQCRYTQTLM